MYFQCLKYKFVSSGGLLAFGVSLGWAGREQSVFIMVDSGRGVMVNSK